MSAETPENKLLTRFENVLKKMNIDELKQGRTLVGSYIKNYELSVKRAEASEKIRKGVEKLAEEQGISYNDAVQILGSDGAPKKKRSLKIKYRLPTGEEWSGVGRMPKVFDAATKGNKDALKKFLVE